MFFFYNSSNTSSLKMCKVINKQYLGQYLLWILRIFPLYIITVNLVYLLQALPFLTEEEIQNENKATSTKKGVQNNRLIKKTRVNWILTLHGI